MDRTTLPRCALGLFRASEGRRGAGGAKRHNSAVETEETQILSGPFSLRSVAPSSRA